MEGRSSADRRGGRYHVILCVVIGEMTLSTCLLCRLLTQDENQSYDSGQIKIIFLLCFSSAVALTTCTRLHTGSYVDNFTYFRYNKIWSYV